MLRKKGKQWYGDDLADLRKEMLRYSAKSYRIGCDYAPVCACGGHNFFLGADDEEDGAALACTRCGQRGFVADSERFVKDEILDDEELCECLCGQRAFEVIVAAALYADTTDVRWWYVGCRCVQCGLVGVYADWKDDGGPFEERLRPPEAPSG